MQQDQLYQLKITKNTTSKFILAELTFISDIWNAQ